jgi:hypothetical protein
VKARWENVAAARFADSDVRRILERAAELDARNEGTVSLQVLQEIASDAGIGPAALHQAVSERSAAAQVRTPESGSPRSLLTTVALIVGGAALGGAAVAVDSMSLGDLSVLAVFGPSGVAAACAAFWHRRRGSRTRFVGDVAVLFAAFTAAVLAMEGTQALAPCLAWALTCGAAGSGIVSHGREEREVPHGRNGWTNA